MNISDESYVPEDRYLFWFEEPKMGPIVYSWMQMYWPMTVLVSFGYVPLIYTLQWLMSYQRPLQLRKSLFCWNMWQSILSAFICSRLFPEIRQAIGTTGFWLSFWFFPSAEKASPSLWWLWVFGVNKGFELIDTVFLVLRKRELTILHLFHHSITFFVSGYVNLFPEVTAFNRWFAFVNSFIHTVMYFYFAIRTVNIKPPRKLSIALTALQIIQLSLFCYVSQQAIWKEPIPFSESFRKQRIIHFIGAIFWINLLLFLNFFYKTYILAPTKQKVTNKTD